MFFEDPRGLLLLGAIPLLVWIMARGLRRREVTVAAFPVLRERLLALPVLPASFLRRRRVQAALLLLAAASIALSAAGLTVGSQESAPVTAFVVVDHLSGADSGGTGSADGWQAVLDAAAGLVGRMRRDDRVLIVRTDTGAASGGPREPSVASALLKSAPASHRALDTGRTIALIRSLEPIHEPEAILVVTPDPRRWRSLQGGTSAPVSILRAGAPVDARNLGIVAAELRPDLLRPREIDLFCRIGAYAAGPAAGETEATVEVRGGGELLERRTMRLPAEGSRGLTFAGLRPPAGLLQVSLLPADHFPGDNRFSAPVRERPFLSAALVSAGNRPLESALRSLPGLELTTAADEAGLGPAGASVIVYDGLVPQRPAGSLLLIQPPRSVADVIVRGEVLRPGSVEVEPGEAVLEGVSFSGLTVSGLPVYLPPPSYRVLAKAGGYPLLLVGRSSAGRRVAILGFDPVASGWHTDPSFPVLVANLVAWLGEETQGAASSYLVGDELPGGLLAGVAAIVDPAGNTHRPPAADLPGFPLDRAGRYLLRAATGGEPAEVHVNLLDERVSRAMAFSAADGGDPLPGRVFPRPFRWYAGGSLVAAAIALLLAELLIAPRRAHGRLGP